ncbi:hypothetical protein M2427_005195 [Bradyrhizobium sp. BR13661]|jgi:hypothetical protein|nr:hypothetical protein [Bradyrhizobium sp. BR13661]
MKALPAPTMRPEEVMRNLAHMSSRHVRLSAA